MRYNDEYTEKPQQAAPTHCRADGCTNPTTFNGLCYFHSEAKNPASWNAITKIMRTHEFRYLAYYWRELSKYHYPAMIRLPETNVMYRPDELIRNFQIRLVRFGIDPALVEFKETDFLRNYAIRMRELVLDHVLAITGANKSAGGIEERVTTMPTWVAPRIRENLKRISGRKAIKYEGEPEMEAA